MERSRDYDENEALNGEMPIREEIEKNVLLFVEKFVKKDWEGKENPVFCQFVKDEIKNFYGNWYTELCRRNISHGTFRNLYLHNTVSVLKNLIKPLSFSEYLQLRKQMFETKTAIADINNTSGVNRIVIPEGAKKVTNDETNRANTLPSMSAVRKKSDPPTVKRKTDPPVDEIQLSQGPDVVTQDTGNSSYSITTKKVPLFKDPVGVKTAKK